MALLLIGGLGACDRGAEAPLDQESLGAGNMPLDYLVRVGSRTLTEEQFENFLPIEFQGLLTDEEKRGFLDRWVDTELLYQAALNSKLQEDPELRTRLEQQRREFIANHLLQKVLKERVVITDTQVADYYTEHLEEYSTEYRYREIVVHNQQEAEEIHQRLQENSVSFSRAAETSSLSSSARTGGDMGWLAKGGMPIEVADRIINMKSQEISAPFETAWGWTLIQLRETRQSENALALQDVQDEILRFLTMEKRRRIYTEFLEELQESHGVTYHPQLEQRLKSGTEADALRNLP